MKFDAVLLIAAGGPERPAEVVPFLQQLQASRALREDQVAAIGEEYEAIGRRSPLNEWTRRQAAALAIELRHRGHALRISCGMRDWHPLIQDSLESLHDSGRGTVLAVVLAAQDGGSGRQACLDAIEAARTELGERGPKVVMAKPWEGRPGFSRALADRIRFATREVSETELATAPLVFAVLDSPGDSASREAHEARMRETARAVAKEVGRDTFEIAWHRHHASTDGAAREPDIASKLAELGARGTRSAILAPLSFVTDDLAVLRDLGKQARQQADAAGIRLFVADTVADHPHFISLLADLVTEEGDAE